MNPAAELDLTGDSVYTTKMSENRTIVLPKLPSALLAIAINDMKWVLKRPNEYQVDMDLWHAPTSTGDPAKSYCSVCFAGAVMARTMKTDRFGPRSDCSFGQFNRAQFRALNAFREGEIGHALSLLGYFVKLSTVLEIRDEATKNAVWLEYAPARAEQFLAQMSRLVRALKKRGL